MNKKLALELQEKYPSILRELYGEPGTTMLDEGIQVGDGWYDMIEYVCQSIEFFKRGLPNEFEDSDDEIVIYNIKRNQFGDELLIYYHGHNPLVENVREIARNISKSVCETCGASKNNCSHKELHEKTKKETS